MHRKNRSREGTSYQQNNDPRWDYCKCIYISVKKFDGKAAVNFDRANFEECKEPGY